MRVTVLFFGLLKDIAGRPEEALELPAGSNTGTVFEHYASQYPRLRGMAGSIALARNQEFCGLEDVLEDGDEIALMPPVSGGSGAGAGAESAGSGSPWIASAAEERGFYALTEKPIETRGLVRRLLDRASGAVITFEGVVRDNSGGRKTRFGPWPISADAAAIRPAGTSARRGWTSPRSWTLWPTAISGRPWPTRTPGSTRCSKPSRSHVQSATCAAAPSWVRAWA